MMYLKISAHVGAKNMTLTDDIEQFQKHTAKSSETLEEVNQLANKLFECSTDELASLFAEIESLCEQAQTQIKYTADCLVEINQHWGSEPLQHYSEKKQNTNQTTGSTIKSGNSSTQSATVSENETKQVEAGDLAPHIDQPKEPVDYATDLINFLKKVVDTSKKLPAFLMLGTSITGALITKTVTLVDEVFFPSIDVLTQQGMPTSKNSPLADIKEMIDKNNEYLGIDPEAVEAYEEKHNEQEEEKRKRKSAAQSRDESRGASSK